jgi:hypothetical protein
LSRDFWGQALSPFDGFDAMRRLGTQESKGLEMGIEYSKEESHSEEFFTDEELN